MKNYFILLAASCTMLLISCKKNTEDTTANTSGANTQLQSGSWKVSTFNMGSTDRTTDFSDFVFNFRGDRSTTAANTFIAANGTWNVGTDNSNTVLNLRYVVEGFQMFTDISGRWTINEHSDNRFVMTRVLPDNNGQVDGLTIEKL